jgi:hypothetical protein
MFSVADLHRLFGDLVASGAGSSVVVFHDAKVPFIRPDGKVVAAGLIPTSVAGEGTALIVDNSELPGGIGKPLCLIACNPFLRSVRYEPIPLGRDPEGPGQPQSDPRSSDVQSVAPA